MTTGQQLIEQGFREGFREAREKYLLLLLRQRFADEVDTDTQQRIAAASIDELDAWVERALSAGTLADVFAA